MAPPATLPVRYQVAVAHQRCPRPFSAKGVMVESIDTPQGDQVERTPPTNAMAMAQTAIASESVQWIIDRRSFRRCEFVVASRRRPEERGTAEGEDAAVAGHQPVPGVVVRRGHPDDGQVQADAAGRSVEGSIAVGEDAAVRRDEPVALACAVAAMATMGLLSGLPPMEPRNGASPKEKMPPSAATSQYPRPVGVAAMPTTGELSGLPPMEPKNVGVAEGEDAPVRGDEPVSVARSGWPPCRRCVR